MDGQKNSQRSDDANHPLEIIASVAEKVTFATQQNDVPVIADLSIRNSTDTTYENLTLQLTCDTDLLASRTWKLDRVAAQGEIRIRDRQVRLEGAKLGELNERLKSIVRFELRKDEELLADSEHDLLGLARNEWGGANYMPELLAAFVTPNDPAVARLLKAAGEALRRSGFQPALNGYQSKSRQRVWQIVSALWAAISEQRFVYAEPPASFEVDGQKVRTPTSIVADGLMTCLDAALLFAACAEQAGLNSIVVFTKGHAFCGVWLQPQELPTLTLEDATELRKYVSLQDIVLFETTFAVHEPPVPFAKAVAEAERLVSEENEADFIYALDIKRARTRQISPLPLFGERVSRGSGQQAQQLRIAVEAPPNLPGFDLGVTDEPTPNTPESRLDHWQRKLLDLSNRNRLLNLRKSKTAITLRSHAPAELEDKLAEGKKITVIPMVYLQKEGNSRDEHLFRDRTGEDFKKQFVEQALERNEIVSDLDDKELTSGLVQLYRKAKSDLKEGGANTLFLALGMLKWKRDDNRTYRAPLILLPVTLERRSAKSKVKIVHHDDEPVFNMTLLQMLRQDFDLALPELQGELPKDESGIDVNRIWRYMQQKVRDISGFEVVEEIVLSTFSFAKFLMWKDLSERTDQLKNSQLVKHLIESPREPYGRSAYFIRPDEIDDRVDPKDLFLPLPADASQIAAIHASTLEGDFILEGPPGTGKSQTIANIIAQNMALGKRILFVSEKMAALEVVYRRLKDVGLGDFCLELHSNKANKKAVLEQLGRSWHSRTSNTESAWYEKTKKLKEIRDGLNSYVRELHRPSHSGISPRKAIGRSVRFRDSCALQLDWPGGLSLDRIASTEGYDKLSKLASDLGAIWAQITPEDRAAFNGVTRADWSMEWQRNAIDAARELRAKIADLKSTGMDLLEKLSITYEPLTVDNYENLAIWARQLPVVADRDLGFGLATDGADCLEALERTLEVLQQYQEGKSRLSIDYSDEAIHSAPLVNWTASWEKAKGSWSLLRVIRERIARGGIAKFANSKIKPSVSNDLPVLEELQAQSRTLLDFGQKYPQVKMWQGPTTNRAEVAICIQTAKSIRNATSRLASRADQLPALRSAVYQAFVTGRELLSPAMPPGHSAARFTKLWLEFEACLHGFAKQLNLSHAAGATVQEIEETAAGVIGRESRLKAWCQWQAASLDARDAGLEALIGALERGIVDSQQSKAAFHTAYSVWLAERLIDDREELRTFSAITHEENIRSFGELDSHLAKLSTEYIRAKLSGDIPDAASPVRQQGYGVLARELQKKMRHKPIRELVGEMGSVLTDLTPCLMMSPLSVAQFLSAEAGPLFDLVVFDEASQITVWDAIGAIARGKNAIIVGDPKQMPPTSFFDRSAEDEDDYETEDLESILDEAMASSVKWHRLTGHYRSRHESLIAFSNHRYYQGDLITYPSSATKESSVQFRKVEGLYQRGSGRTNPEEAQAVVSEVVQRLEDSGEDYLSIGIVTLNSEQQRLIDDLLDDARRQNPLLERFFSDEIEEPVFVKNLETVQGDQRDVILLSISYGPDTPGANTMSMNFGPLNRKGGERRLNVAITRATTEIVLFASFDPSMIDLTRTSAAAVRDLKHYMEFAQRGPRALGEAIQSVGGYDQYDSEFEREVADQLRRRGWTVQTQIGVSKFRVDLGVVHPDEPGQFLAGIECDGATYHSLPSARDRDRVRQAILEGLGWKLVRIWSTDYFVDPQSSIDKVDAALAALLEKSKAREEQRDPTSSVSGPTDKHGNVDSLNRKPPDQPDSSKIAHPKAASFHVSESGHQVADSLALLPDRFYDEGYRKVLRLYAIKIIDEVGPINFAALCEKIARAHGFKRTGKQIKGQIWSSVSRARKHVRAPDRHTVFWPDNIEPSEVVEYRGLSLSDGERNWSDVPYPEKRGLAMKILRTRGSQDPIDIICRKVGISRLTKPTRAALVNLFADASQLLKTVGSPG